MHRAGATPQESVYKLSCPSNPHSQPHAPLPATLLVCVCNLLGPLHFEERRDVRCAPRGARSRCDQARCEGLCAASGTVMYSP